MSASGAQNHLDEARSPPRRCTAPGGSGPRGARSTRGAFAPWTEERRLALGSRPGFGFG